MAELFTLESLVALLTLTGLEIVLGIDNIIFIAIVVGRLPPEARDRARRLGLMLAVVSRLLLLLGLGLMVQHFTATLFTIGQVHFSGKDLILLAGGVFLIGKASYEIHHRVRHGLHEEGHQSGGGPVPSLGNVLVQVLILDVVFSLDSVITAVGMTAHLPIMMLAVVLAIGVMLVFSGAVVRFVDRNPSIKILALSFLLLIGVLLVGEGFHQEISKGYVYFAMAFALVVDLLQLRAERRAKPAA